jgi:hypothetical protein
MLTCLHCGKSFSGTRSPLYCSAACRTARYRAHRTARLARLIDEARAALASGDVVGLERVARGTVALLST